jgi:DNA-binding transcriptional regulator YiaG
MKEKQLKGNEIKKIRERTGDKKESFPQNPQ